MIDQQTIDKALEAAEWKAVDGQYLERLLKGKTIAGAEPIDYPLTDGALFYLTGNSEDLTVLEIGCDPFYGEDDGFYMRYTEISPQGDNKSLNAAVPETGGDLHTQARKIKRGIYRKDKSR